MKNKTITKEEQEVGKNYSKAFKWGGIGTILMLFGTSFLILLKEVNLALIFALIFIGFCIIWNMTLNNLHWYVSFLQTKYKK